MASEGVPNGWERISNQPSSSFALCRNFLVSRQHLHIKHISLLWSGNFASMSLHQIVIVAGTASNREHDLHARPEGLSAARSGIHHSYQEVTNLRPPASLSTKVL